MRAWAIALVVAGLVGCSPNGRELDSPEVPTFDGAGVVQKAALTAHGERISWVLGCHGCHGKDLLGQAWDDDPAGYGTLWAANLTRSVPTMSDSQFATLMRTGKHPTRTDMWSMPSELFQHLSAKDMAALITYLRSIAPAGVSSPPTVLGPKSIAEIKAGSIKSAAEMVTDPSYRLPPDLGPATALGRQIVSMTCAECHGGQLTGQDKTPDLVAATAYSRPDFEVLMTKGIPIGDRKLDLMAKVAKSRFSRLTPNERDAIYAYLMARAEQTQQD
ncbi:MAG: cytochrome c [Sphingomicrobium sp.]